MIDSRLRELERAVEGTPGDLAALRRFADERKRLGLELLPDVRRREVAVSSLADSVMILSRAICLDLGLPAYLLAQEWLDGATYERMIRAVPRRRRSAYAGILADLAWIDASRETALVAARHGWLLDRLAREEQARRVELILREAEGMRHVPDETGAPKYRDSEVDAFLKRRAAELGVELVGGKP